jgi:hypothetical protein
MDPSNRLSTRLPAVLHTHTASNRTLLANLSILCVQAVPPQPYKAARRTKRLSALVTRYYHGLQCIRLDAYA